MMMFQILCLVGFLFGINCARLSVPEMVSHMHAREIRDLDMQMLESIKMSEVKVDESKQRDERETEEEIEETQGYSAEEKKEIIRQHNEYRGRADPPAANMAFMEWDEELAELAEIWVGRCSWEDQSIPPNDRSNFLGLLAYTFHSSNSSLVEKAYSIRDTYNFENNLCPFDSMCLYYKQLMTAQVKAVGCARKKCPRWFNVACIYDYRLSCMFELKPYEAGKPCHMCESGSLCYKNTCMTREQCERNPEECKEAECELNCKNCGKMNKEKCECECADGWDSKDCSLPCVDENEWCGKYPGFDNPSTCPVYEFKVRDIYCRKMCGQCKGVTESSTNLCCGGKICENGFILNGTDPQSGCSCEKL